MTEHHLVTERHAYETIRAVVTSVFEPAARLPDTVFRKPGPATVFCEFDAVLGADFWPALCELARWHGDDRIYLLVLDPDPEASYVPVYGTYPAFSLATDAGKDAYWSALSEEPQGDVTAAVAFSAETVVLTGPSGRWGCWGERSFGVAALQGFPRDEGAGGWLRMFQPLLSVGDALGEYIAPNFDGCAVPTEFALALRQNYSP